MEGNGQQLEATLVEYDHLPAPQLDEQLLAQIDANIKGGHWYATFQCITMIRGICKAYPQHVPDIFAKYGMALLELFGNAATLNLKNILKLLREVFLLGQTINVETLVAAFLPLLVKRAANDSGQVKEGCQELMTIVASHCCYPRVIERTTPPNLVSADLSLEKNLAISEVAIKLLSVVIMNIGNSLTQLSPGTLQMLMKGMSLLVGGKRNNMKTSALDVCVFICNQIGS
jgi:hypothetical protein